MPALMATRGLPNDVWIRFNAMHRTRHEACGSSTQGEAVCRSMGFEPPIICTPEELTEE